MPTRLSLADGQTMLVAESRDDIRAILREDRPVHIRPMWTSWHPRPETVPLRNGVTLEGGHEPDDPPA